MHNTEIFQLRSSFQLCLFLWTLNQSAVKVVGHWAKFIQDQRHVLKTGHKIIETRFSKFLYIKVRIMVLMLSVNKPFISMGVFYSSSMAVNNSCLYCVYHKSNVFHFSCYIYCVKSLQKKKEILFFYPCAVYIHSKR